MFDHLHSLRQNQRELYNRLIPIEHWRIDLDMSTRFFLQHDRIELHLFPDRISRHLNDDVVFFCFERKKHVYLNLPCLWGKIMECFIRCVYWCFTFIWSKCSGKLSIIQKNSDAKAEKIRRWNSTFIIKIVLLMHLHRLMTLSWLWN